MQTLTGPWKQDYRRITKTIRHEEPDRAPGGGYIAGAVHCFQPDVPVENTLAMCDEVQKAGRYPISC
jgi:hypothetical protein